MNLVLKFKNNLIVKARNFNSLLNALSLIKLLHRLKICISNPVYFKYLPGDIEPSTQETLF
jgi:hypothetical protein